MKDLSYLNKYRVCIHKDGYMGDDYNGAFQFFTREGCTFVIASNGEGWEHISVSLKHKTPSWETMCEIKDMFFTEDETVIQFHPKKSDYVNLHKNCLHLWKPIEEEIKLPPIKLV